ncbi:hypothetical protein E2F47_27530 [Mycobacterium eburneum]|nr:hypothetical protein E2F47_27530 [Mycobacterium eburneum]
MATDTVAALRQTWGRPSERHRVQPLIDELRCSSAEFKTGWKAHTVASKSHATKLIEHPSGGRSEQALKILGTLSATERAKGR